MLKHIEDALRTEIQALPEYNVSDCFKLLKQLDACNKAVQGFMKGEIDEDTFLDILEANGHDIDDYLSITDSNLVIFGL